mmetsp:Transcript_86/g.152  ORF Transcript_86/g.152 Transcript_86/m.152 type:complete len:194 (-) Transcript_86:1601-2182(-)|eukprot:CAMPEP_0172429432 /NCGR_PEP_ID=MMETSP1064-20121228/50291_1 /TAXON_ID=202472 /ORGANISM="Aulacoseira subarctica , Strain CCAP 1002/5" /LENGTH=193 /DNA_ID=CAMNT_0013174819 /DNA_START=51 /DNA_END=632 /DNA_ORIENTATION=+
MATDKNDGTNAKHMNEEDMDFFDDEKPNTLNDEESPSSSTNELRRISTAQLRSSLKNIGTAVDERLGIAKAAQNIDKTVKITNTAQRAASYVSVWTQSVNEKYHLSGKASGLWNQVNEKLKVSETATDVASKIQQYDHKVGASTRAVSVLAKGAEFVERRVVGKEDHGETAVEKDEAATQDGIEMESKEKSSK